MGFFSFLSKNKIEKNTPEYFSVDFHSHLIPGIDDGSKSLEESADIVRFFYSLGVRKMITTPHISMDYYPNKPEQILLGFNTLKEYISSLGIEMKIEVAAEYMIDDGFPDLIKNGGLLTFGDKYILIELGGFMLHPEFFNSVFELQSSGYNVILAHPERYSFWFHDKKIYKELKDRDICFQMNLLSLTGYYSSEVNNSARWLIDNKMVDFIGSDVHHFQQKDHLLRAIQTPLFEKVKNSGTISNNNLM